MTACDTLTNLLHAVLRSPEDDLPRLVYADALEETGEAERAEYIRYSIKLYHDPVPEWSEESRRFYVLKKRGFVWDYPKEVDGICNRGFVQEIHCPLIAWIGEPCDRCDERGWIREPQWAFGSVDCHNCSGTGRVNAYGIKICATEPGV